MPQSSSEFTGTAGAESIAYSEATLKVKSLKDIPDTAHTRKHDRVQVTLIGNVTDYEFGIDKNGNDVMVRVIEPDLMLDIKVLGRMPEKLRPVTPPADPDQISADEALEGGDDAQATADTTEA